MRRVHWTVLLSVAVLAVVLVGANGLKPGPTKVGVCDVRKVVMEYKRFQELRTDLEKVQTDAKTEIEQREVVMKGLREQMKDLKKGSEDFKRLQDALWQKSVEARAYGEIQKGRMELQQHEGLMACYGDALAEIKAYSSETGIDIVYSTREVQMDKARSTEDLEALIATKYILHSDPGIDISDAVLKRLNDKYTAGAKPE